MPRAIYFDCFSGISGDMALGALLDAGLALDRLRVELAKLVVGGWQLDAQRDMRGYLSGTRALVDAPEQPVHRHLSDVQQIIEGSTLAAEVKVRSLKVFTLLAEAEGQVHGVSREQVHFHEVGALDAIIDIVGVVAGLWLLGIDEVYASALPLGTGWARAAHGALPIPAPATLNLLAAVNAPITDDTTPFELVTPTGAALLAGLATFTRPALRLSAVGYGLGKRQLERPNALRVWIGERGSEEPRVKSEELKVKSEESQDTRRSAPGMQNSKLKTQNSELVLLETNIDDQPAEQLAYVAEQLLARGALDVWQVPLFMKKGRLATMLSALVPAPLEDAAVGLILRETTTLGVRRRAVERHLCEREIVTVATPLGAVRVKRKSWQEQALGGAPEYEDCARLARTHGLPLREVYQIVAAQLDQES